VPLLAAGVQRLSNGGGTALYDADLQSVQEKLLRDTSDHPIRKAIVISATAKTIRASTRAPRPVEMARARRSSHLCHFDR